jgi:hypothetical protein
VTFARNGRALDEIVIAQVIEVPMAVAAAMKTCAGK